MVVSPKTFLMVTGNALLSAATVDPAPAVLPESFESLEQEVRAAAASAEAAAKPKVRRSTGALSG
jgi:hypothetical protein